EVMTLARVVRRVEQFPPLRSVFGPHVRRGWREVGRLPSVVPDRGRTSHRIELRRLRGLSGWVGEGGREADPLERILRVALERLGRLDVEAFVDGRDDVDRVRVLATDAWPGDAAGPGDDHRVGGAALVVGIPLPHLERRVERPGPPGRVVVV